MRTAPPPYCNFFGTLPGMLDPIARSGTAQSTPVRPVYAQQHRGGIGGAIERATIAARLGKCLESNHRCASVPVGVRRVGESPGRQIAQGGAGAKINKVLTVTLQQETGMPIRRIAYDGERGAVRVRRLGGVLIGIALAYGGGVSAQERYPAKPVRIVVSFAAGGPTDTVARVMAGKMTELLGQTFVVENRAGAGGNTGAAIVADASPDGYTLLMATVSTHAINPGLYRKMPYDPVRDFAPVAQVGVTPSVLAVHPSVPAHDVQSLVALMKANPGKFSYGSSGLGSILHLCGEQFKTSAGGLDATHVPYKGSAPMISDLVGGQITMAFDALPTVLPQLRAGKIRALGAGMATRARALPDLPTLQEQGIAGFECYTWNAILAPAKTSPLIVALLADAINKSLADPNVFKRLQDVGVDPTPDSTPEKLAEFIKFELAKWAPIIKASGAQID
jgi:tripartite-type tricarboxylate transporter receptor subunit TctC